MPEIREEIMIFFTAVLTGAVLRTAYRCISCLREWIRHEPVAIELEDLFYWIAASIYFFVQIYHTSSGGIRWSFLLGCVGGAAFASFLIKKIEKIGKKIYMRKQNKFSENLAGKKKKG